MLLNYKFENKSEKISKHVISNFVLCPNSEFVYKLKFIATVQVLNNPKNNHKI